MIKYIIYTILFTLTISPLVAQDIGADQTIPMDPDIRIGKLDNGLTYYIRHSENPKNRGEFYIVHNVGAMQEEDNQNGLAHFLEHMAFNGTKHFPKKTMLEYLASIGKTASCMLVKTNDLNVIFSCNSDCFRNIFQQNTELAQITACDHLRIFTCLNIRVDS